MPQIPSPVPTVAPTDQPISRVSVNTPEAAFGGATAAAISNLGRTLESSGNELFARAIALKQVDNEAEAKDADSRYMIEAGKIHAEYNSLQGDAAVKGYDPYVAKLKEVRTKIRGDLSNEAVKKLYDSGSLPTMGRTIFNGAGVAATAQKQYVAGASSARVEALQDQTLQSPDERTFRASLGSIETEIRGTQATLAGWSPEKTDEEVSRAKSKLITLRIQGLARKSPEAAKDFLETNRSSLVFGDVNRADQLVQSALHTQGAKNIAGDVNDDLRDDPLGKDKTLQQRVDEAREKAKKIDPDDSGLADAAVQRTIGDFEQSRKIKRDIDQTNINTLNKALVGGNDPNGKLPTMVEELTADPQARNAWEQLDSTQQRTMLKALTQNAKGDQSWTEASQRRMLQLQGLSQADPKEFLGIDVASENLPFSAKRALIQTQIKLKDKAEGDPRVMHGLQVLRPMLQAAGLDASKDKDRYYQFVGSLQDAMDAYQKDNKRLPKADEIQTMGARLLQEQPTYFWQSKRLMFENPVPDPVANRIKADPFWTDRGVTPTDADIQRIYNREQYQKLFGGAKSEQKPQVPRG